MIISILQNHKNRIPPNTPEEERIFRKERENESWGGELEKEIQGGGKYKQMRKETGRNLGEVRKQGEKRGRKEA